MTEPQPARIAASETESRAVEKIRAEINKMMAETAKLNREFSAEKIRADIDKTVAETAKLSREFSTEKISAEISKALAETAKLNRESQWHPVMVAAALMGATAAAVKLLF